MKLLKRSALVLLFSSAATFLSAGPGPQYWETLRTQQQFQKLKAGDQIAYVCTQCKSVSVAGIETTHAAMEQCKEGNTVTCPACSAKTKITVKRQRNDPPVRHEIVYVNAKGEECMFVAKVVAAK